MNHDISFCIMSFKRSDWLKRCLLSIRDYCKLKHTVLLLAVDESPHLFEALVKEIEPQNTEIISSPQRLTSGSGRKLLAETVESDITMIMDDDTRLTTSTINSALQVLDGYPEVGAVSMPHYDELGHMISPGGKNLVIRNGVVRRAYPKLDFDAKWIEVQDLDGSAMIYRTEMRKDFSWDGRYSCAFEDLDKSLSILRSGKWKQAIVPRGRVIHDKSGLGKTPEYEKRRFDGLAVYQSYGKFRSKWGLRLDFRAHLLATVILPSLTILHSQRAIGLVNNQVRRRMARRLDVQNDF